MRLVDLIAVRLGLCPEDAEIFWLLGTYSWDYARIGERIGMKSNRVADRVQRMAREMGASSVRELVAFAHVCVQQKVGPLVPGKGK